MGFDDRAQGEYRVDGTPLHRVDARAKLAVLLVWTVCLFQVDSWLALVGVALVVSALLAVARVSLSHVARGLAPLVLVLAVLVCSSALRFDGSGSWTLVGLWGIDPEGLLGGFRAALRIVLMVGMSLVLSATTSATQLADALSSMLWPLRRLGVPVGDLATMLSTGMRFIPVCAEQLDRVACAQRARGAAVGEGGPVRRVVSWVPVMVPVVVGLFRRADALARSMRARCYRGRGRTQLLPPRMRLADIAVLAGCIVLAVLISWFC